MTQTFRPVRIQSIAFEAPGVLSFRLTDPGGRQLLAYSPGAHVDVRLPNGVVRPYSLIGNPETFETYEIGVVRELQSRGGSRWLHESARPGDIVEVAPPRNNFPLDETAAASVLIGGGIGVTPLIGMAERLDRLGCPFELHLCARSRAEASFVERLSVFGYRIATAFSREPTGSRLDIRAVVEATPFCAHLYCCGPASMIATFEAAAAGRPASHVHIERFVAAEPKAVEGGFIVELAKSGLTIEIPPGKSILDCVLEAGVNVGFSCIEGVCGSCETRVTAGTPDHRDVILSPSERASNTTMMICCSGSKSERLTLDL